MEESPTTIGHHTGYVTQKEGHHGCEPDFLALALLVISRGKPGDATSLITRMGEDLKIQGVLSRKHGSAVTLRWGLGDCRKD